MHRRSVRTSPRRAVSLCAASVVLVLHSTLRIRRPCTPCTPCKTGDSRLATRAHLGSVQSQPRHSTRSLLHPPSTYIRGIQLCRIVNTKPLSVAQHYRVAPTTIRLLLPRAPVSTLTFVTHVGECLYAGQSQYRCICTHVSEGLKPNRSHPIWSRRLIEWSPTLISSLNSSRIATRPPRQHVYESTLLFSTPSGPSYTETSACNLTGRRTKRNIRLFSWVRAVPPGTKTRPVHATSRNDFSSMCDDSISRIPRTVRASYPSLKRLPTYFTAWSLHALLLVTFRADLTPGIPPTLEKMDAAW